jgi:hypothetical protein
MPNIFVSSVRLAGMEFKDWKHRDWRDQRLTAYRRRCNNDVWVFRKLRTSYEGLSHRWSG